MDICSYGYNRGIVSAISFDFNLSMGVLRLLKTRKMRIHNVKWSLEQLCFFALLARQKYQCLDTYLTLNILIGL